MVRLAHHARRGLMLTLAAVSATGCCCPTSYAAAAADVVARPSAPIDTTGLGTALGKPADSVTQAQFRHVDFDVGLGIVLGIRYLRGRVANATPRGAIVFDDKQSFLIHLDTAEVALSTASLGHLMNGYVFAYPRAPLRNLSFTISGTQLRQRGVLHKGVDIPFEMTASLSVTPDGLIRIRPTAMKICSLDGTGLMNALGIELSDLVDVSGAKGVSVRGNDLLLDPKRALPPPAISGRLVGVRVEGGEVIQTFGPPAAWGPAPVPLSPPDSAARNYMYFRGGTLRFGKLVMVDSDMQIVDLDPRTSFDFNIAEYQRQLVAGYSKTRPDQSLVVFMPDYSSVSPREPDRP